MNITEKFSVWPERAQIPVRLHLYDVTLRERCDPQKLLTLFDLAKQYGVQQRMETNLNGLNAVYVYLDNYVLTHRDFESAHRTGWGDHWGFLLALIERFPNDVYVDPPERTEDFQNGTRFALEKGGEVSDEIQTWDDMA